MPQIIYGTAWKKDETSRLVENAFMSGFRAFDTANQPKHYQEPLVGEALGVLMDRGVRREDLFIQTKFTPLDGQDNRIPYDRNSEVAVQVQQSIASSLEHLKTSYLDSYLLHGPYGHPGLAASDWEVWRALESLHASGKVRAIGISNVNHGQLAELIERAATPPMVVQNRCYANRGWDRAVRTLCRSHNIIYQGFSLLTANPGVLSHPKVLEFARRLRVTSEQVIYRFSISAGMVPLSGTTNAKHMREALESVSLELSQSEVEIIERIEG